MIKALSILSFCLVRLRAGTHTLRMPQTGENTSSIAARFF
jgi:hypothetical protein